MTADIVYGIQKRSNVASVQFLDIERFFLSLLTHSDACRYTEKNENRVLR